MMNLGNMKPWRLVLAAAFFGFMLPVLILAWRPGPYQSQAKGILSLFLAAAASVRIYFWSKKLGKAGRDGEGPEA